MRYFFGGINGVGKSSLINEIIKLKPEYILVHHTKELMKWLGIEDNYNKLRGMDQDYIKSELDPKFIDYLLKSKISKTILLDSHYTNLIKGDFFRTTGAWIANFDALTLVTSPVNEIYQRIIINQRDRALFPLNTNSETQLKYLEKYAEGEKNEFLNLVKKYKKSHLIIHNQQNKLREAVNRFLEFEKLPH